MFNFALNSWGAKLTIGLATLCSFASYLTREIRTAYLGVAAAALVLGLVTHAFVVRDLCKAFCGAEYKFWHVVKLQVVAFYKMFLVFILLPLVEFIPLIFAGKDHYKDPINQLYLIPLLLPLQTWLVAGSNLYIFQNGRDEAPARHAREMLFENFGLYAPLSLLIILDTLIGLGAHAISNEPWFTMTYVNPISSIFGAILLPYMCFARLKRLDVGEEIFLPPAT